jgi:hypothetical protein
MIDSPKTKEGTEGLTLINHLKKLKVKAAANPY